jgi:cyanate lyase
MCAVRLTELSRIPTSGAQAVEPFDLDGRAFAVVEELPTSGATDVAVFSDELLYRFTEQPSPLD